MKSISILALESIENSSDPEKDIHVFIFNKFKEDGYVNTLDSIRQTLSNKNANKYLAVENYLRNRVNKNELFEPYKEELLGLTLRLDENKLELWVINMIKKEFNNQQIFEILSELFVFIQFSPKTQGHDAYYNFMADFLDRNTN